MRNMILKRGLVLIALFLIIAASFASFASGCTIKNSDSTFDTETCASIENIFGFKYGSEKGFLYNPLINDNSNHKDFSQFDYGLIEPIWIANQSYQEWYKSIEVYEDYIYVAGYGFNAVNETYYGIIGKYDLNNGNQIWMKNWFANQPDTLIYCLDVYNDGIYITGASCDFRAITGYVDSFICKFDLDGNQIWSKCLNESLWNFGYSIIGHNDFIYVCGHEGYESSLFKYDINGNFIWKKTYEIPGTNFGEFIDFEIYGGYIYVDGQTDSDDDTRQDLLIAKIDCDGELQWYKEWGGKGPQLGGMMHIGDNGFIYIAGISAKDYIYISDIIWKIDLNGNIKWEASTYLKSTLVDVAYWNGDVYGIGDDRTFYRDALLANFDAQGKLIWYLTYKSDDWGSYADAFTMDEYDDYFYLVGSNMGAGYIMKYDVTKNSDNNKPNTPSKPSGPQFGITGKMYFYSSAATDPDDDLLSYCFSCGPGHNCKTHFESSGQTMEGVFIWTFGGIYSICVRSRDEYGFVSDWSESLIVFIIGPGDKMVHNTLFVGLLDRFPNAFPILRYIYRLY